MILIYFSNQTATENKKNTLCSIPRLGLFLVSATKLCPPKLQRPLVKID